MDELSLLWHIFVLPPVCPQSRNNAQSHKDSTIAEQYAIMILIAAGSRRKGTGEPLKAKINIQERLKNLRTERHLSDEMITVLQKKQTSHSTVTNMFNRNNTPTLPTLEAVCNAFGITLARFFTEDEESLSTS